MVIHVVKPGDSLYSIALSYNVPLSQILNDNQLPDPSRLVVGQTLVIQFPEEVYTVQDGDTLYSIANTSGTSLRQLLRNNPSLSGSMQLSTGQQLVLRYRQEPLGELSVNAYAYPNIARAASKNLTLSL